MVLGPQKQANVRTCCLQVPSRMYGHAIASHALNSDTMRAPISIQIHASQFPSDSVNILQVCLVERQHVVYDVLCTFGWASREDSLPLCIYLRQMVLCIHQGHIPEFVNQDARMFARTWDWSRWSSRDTHTGQSRARGFTS